MLRLDVHVIPKRPQAFDVDTPVLSFYLHATVFYSAEINVRSEKNWDVEFMDKNTDESNKVKEIEGRLILHDS